MKKKIVIACVLAVSLVIGAVPAWAQATNPLAEAAYNARMAEADKNKSAADAIKKAVLNDKKGNPAQAAYDARIKENNALKTGKFDSSKKDNPADKIYQAVINEQKRMGDEAANLAAKFNTREAQNALDTIEKFLEKIPDTQLTKPAKNVEMAVNAYQLVKNIKLMVDKSNLYKNSTGAIKNDLHYELAYMNLDFIGRIGSFGLGKIQSTLLSYVIDGAKGIVAAHKYYADDLALISYGLHDYVNAKSADRSAYRNLAITLMRNGLSAWEIDEAVDALELFNKLK